MFDLTGIHVLPHAICPVCVSTYAALLGAVGLGFLTDSAILFPLFIAGLALAVGGLAVKARARKKSGPLTLGLIAVAVVVVGKYVLGLDADAAYLGVVLMIAASVWNFWS